VERNPRYRQLDSQLRDAIRNQYQGGDKFLTEREISQQFSVSRATANKALASMVSAGLLEFRRGIGTFVRSDIQHYDVRSLVSFTEKVVASGKIPSTRLVHFGSISGDKIDSKIVGALQVDPPTELWDITRVRLADDVPVILEHRYLVQSACPQLTQRQVLGSLYQALTETYQLRVTGAEAIIRAVLPSQEEAEHLGIPCETPVLEVTAVGLQESDIPLWWERTLYRGDQYEFYSRLGPIENATPANGKLRT